MRWLLLLALIGCGDSKPEDAVVLTDATDAQRFSRTSMSSSMDPGLLGWCYPTTTDAGPDLTCFSGPTSHQDCINDPKRPPTAMCGEF
jgi:hypothetical protein